MQTRATLAALMAVTVLALLAGCQDAAKIQEEAASARSQIIGSPAPDFTLKDQNGTDVTLSKLRGQWVVLYFYPKDDTPGCTCEATEFTKDIRQFHNLNAKVYGVSADSVNTHKLFVEKFNLGIDLLSDPDHKVMKSYGAWVETYLGQQKSERAIRSTVIVDPQGVIRYHWPEVIPTGHAARVKERLQQLQAQHTTAASTTK
jgi:thioredoxin-dependent peroxiredoxin